MAPVQPNRPEAAIEPDLAELGLLPGRWARFEFQNMILSGVITPVDQGYEVTGPLTEDVLLTIDSLQGFRTTYVFPAGSRITARLRADQRLGEVIDVHHIWVYLTPMQRAEMNAAVHFEWSSAYVKMRVESSEKMFEVQLDGNNPEAVHYVAKSEFVHDQ